MLEDQHLHKTERKLQQNKLNPKKGSIRKHQVSVISEQVIFKGLNFGLKHVTCSIGNEKHHTFEAAFRTTKERFPIDGVSVVPVVEYTDKTSQLIIIANYRPPAKKFCLQFPSGMVQQEDLQEQARRQTLEETGYKVKKFVEIPHPLMYSDPWRSNESMVMYVATVDGDEKIQQQKLDNDENIRVHNLPIDQNFLKNLNALAQEHDYAIEKNVWAVGLGMVIAQLAK